MPDVEKILRLVAEGVLTAEEADEILSAGSSARHSAPSEEPSAEPANTSAARQGGQNRHLRIEVHENGKRVVNLRVPMNIAGWASSVLPGLSDETADRIRGAMESGERGPLVDITDDDGSRVLIVSE
jgi:hypothetical protein